jgi:hypothetical protein
VLDDLPLRRSVDLLEPHAIGEAPVRRLVLPHDLGQGLDVIRRLVDVELDLDSVADLARGRRAPSAAMSIVPARKRGPPRSARHQASTYTGTRTAARRSAARRSSAKTHRTMRCSMYLSSPWKLTA